MSISRITGPFPADWNSTHNTLVSSSCYWCLYMFFLRFSIFHSFLRLNSISPSLAFFWIKPSKCCSSIFSFLRTYHSHFCYSSQKSLINLLAIHWAAFSSYNSRRNYLTSQADFFPYEVIYWLLTKSVHVFFCYAKTQLLHVPAVISLKKKKLWFKKT